MSERFELIRNKKRSNAKPVPPPVEDGHGFSWWEGDTLHWSLYPNVAVNGLTPREIELLKIKHGKKGKPAKSVNVKRSLYVKECLAKGWGPTRIFMHSRGKYRYSQRSIAAACAALSQAKEEELLKQTATHQLQS